MKFDFKEKNVIVTGAGSGLGKCIAEEFAKAGANVVVVDIDNEKAKETTQELKKYGVKSFSSGIDVTNYNEFNHLVTKTVNKFGSIDILINSAGICILSPILNMPIKELDNVVDIDLKGSMYGCKAVLSHMKKQGYGKIINMSSIAGKLCGENTSIYSSVKAGIIALTTSLAREFARDNININCILPGIIRTNMWEGMLDAMTNNADIEQKNSVFSKYENSIPQGRAQDPIDIANMTLFLCTEEARNITGQNIGVDGGQTF